MKNKGKKLVHGAIALMLVLILFNYIDTREVVDVNQGVTGSEYLFDEVEKTYLSLKYWDSSASKKDIEEWTSYWLTSDNTMSFVGGLSEHRYFRQNQGPAAAFASKIAQKETSHGYFVEAHGKNGEYRYKEGEYLSGLYKYGWYNVDQAIKDNVYGPTEASYQAVVTGAYDDIMDIPHLSSFYRPYYDDMACMIVYEQLLKKANIEPDPILGTDYNPATNTYTYGTVVGETTAVYIAPEIRDMYVGAGAYLKANPDVAEAYGVSFDSEEDYVHWEKFIGIPLKNLVYSHWINYGCKENRRTYPIGHNFYNGNLS